MVKDPTTSPIVHVANHANDEIQASIYNSLVGFYRLAFSSLRNVIEQMTIGLHIELEGDQVIFNDWINGDQELKFGWAADKVHKHSSVGTLESYLIDNLNDSLFRQKNQKAGPGFARRLFSELSNFTHGGPEFTNADMWQDSTGPIFVLQAFKRWIGVFAKTYSFGVLEAKLAHPNITNLAFGSSLTIKDLYERAFNMVPQKEDGYIILNEVLNLTSFW